jgi:serine/threonine-protein kinase
MSARNAGLHNPFNFNGSIACFGQYQAGLGVPALFPITMLRVTPEEFRRIEAVFGEALEHAPSDRAFFIEKACAGDRRLQSQVEDLLRLHSESDEFLEQPMAEMLGLMEPLDIGNATVCPGAVLLGRFTILEPIEDARPSSIFLAKDSRLHGKLVIVKIISRLAEAHALSAVSHPSVAGILEFGTLENGDHFVVVERVVGASLRQILRGGALERNRALRLIRQLASTVAHAHEQGIRHLDLKPENVIVSDEGTAEERANLLDFGLARMEGAEDPQLGGSLGYIAPEQWRGEPDYESDIYSLGVMLREMLTGARPSNGNEMPRLPGPIGEVLWKATAVSRQDRFRSCREFIAALESASARPLLSTVIALLLPESLNPNVDLDPCIRVLRNPD